MFPGKFEDEEKDQIFQNRIIYRPTVRLGLWNEELALEENKVCLMTYKMEHCQLMLQKIRRMFRNVLKATHLAVEAPYVKFGELYQFRASDVTVSNSHCKGNLNLAGVINEKDIDVVQHFRHGCAISASPANEPCVRNTFTIVGFNEDKTGQQVMYGENVLLQIIESSGPPLYIQCRSQTTETLGGHLSLNLSETPDIFCRFKFLDWNPQKRYETTRTNTFKPNSRVIIKHSASGQNVSIEPEQWIPSFFGPECVVSCHTYTDVHKMEKPENFWKIVTRPMSNKALYVRAAKGEDIPPDMYEN